jgi:hypothetical protein
LGIGILYKSKVIHSGNANTLCQSVNRHSFIEAIEVFYSQLIGVTMKTLSVVLSVNDHQERLRMRHLLQHAGWSVKLISQDNLSNTNLIVPTLIVANSTLKGTEVVDTINTLLSSSDNLCVIFVLPKSPEIPLWGEQFTNRKVGYFTFGYVDAEFVSFVRAFADLFG